MSTSVTIGMLRPIPFQDTFCRTSGVRWFVEHHSLQINAAAYSILHASIQRTVGFPMELEMLDTYMSTYMHVYMMYSHKLCVMCIAIYVSIQARLECLH